jgi:hypothetical protein
VYAIYHDFADSPDGLDRARELLESIKQNAVLEQETGFDPSASSGPGNQSSADIISELGSLGTSSNTAPSENTEITRSSKTRSSESLDEASSRLASSTPNERSGKAEDFYIESVEALEPATKEAQLIEFFPTLKPSLVAYTLRKCNWSFSKATDELLNHVYFEVTDGDDKITTKGVDAFFTDDRTSRVGKSKAKKARKDMEPSSRSPRSYSPVSLGGPSANKWKDGNHIVEFIAPRVSMSTTEVGSIYHQSGGSARATIQAILDSDIKKSEGKEIDSIIMDHAVELLSDFPSMELTQAISLTRTTHPSTAHAHELAKMLFASSQDTQKGGIQLVRRYAPINLADSPPSSPDPGRQPLPRLTAYPPSVASLAASRDAAFTQASAAHRKGKSDPLMRAAAGYYGQVGRDYNAALKATAAADADALVRAQSSPVQLDLHGVGVKDATRIARESVTAWWHGLGEARVNGRGIGAGYRIVTGVGHHSEGGRGKIGPAVGKMLIREGWKVEFGTGFLVVKGVVKTK